MQTQIYPSTLNLHTEKLEKLVEDLESKFPNTPIHPKEEINAIMYKAGQASVVAYVKQLLDEYMCIFSIETGKTAGTPAIAPSIPQDTGLPDAKPTIAPDEVASVKYGTSKKESGPSGANRTGTDALKINLDDTSGASTGGVNTNV